MTAVRSDGELLDGPWLEQRSGQLFKLLVTARGRVLRTDEIIESLWPGAELSALSNVRFVVHELRKRLDGPGRGERGAGSLVVSHRGGYRLDTARLEVDADRFTGLVAEGLARLRAGEPVAAAPSIAAAVELYRGDYLADEPYTEWVLEDRERLRGLAAEVLHAAGEIAEHRQDLEAATQAAEQLSRLEPYDDGIQRRLIELCVRRGRRSEALRRFAALEARLERDLGERPGFTFQSIVACVAA